MKLQLNKAEYEIDTVDELSIVLDKIDLSEYVEAWIESTDGKSLCVLKNDEFILLMYLRFPGDVGFVSGAQENGSKMIEFHMANGQVDEFPHSWCICRESVYKSISYFFVNAGEQYPHIAWHVV